MGIFNSEYFSTVTESLEEELPVVEGVQYDYEVGGAANIAMESYEDQLEIVKAIHRADMLELREASETVLEASIKEVFSKIIGVIKGFFGKIADFFKKLHTSYLTMVKTNKSFAKKYTKYIEKNKGKLDNFSIQGYDYSVFNDGGQKEEDSIVKISDDVNKNLESLTTAIKGALDKFSSNQYNEDRQKNYDAASDDNKGAIDGTYSKGNISNADKDTELSKIRDSIDNAADIVFTSIKGVQGLENLKDMTAEAWYKKYRNNATEKKAIPMDATKLIAELKGLETLGAHGAKKAEASLNKSMDKILKCINECEKEYNKAASGPARTISVMAAQSAQKSCINAKSKILTMCSVYRSCVADFANQTKSATLKAVSIIRANKKAAGEPDDDIEEVSSSAITMIDAK